MKIKRQPGIGPVAKPRNTSGVYFAVQGDTLIVKGKPKQPRLKKAQDEYNRDLMRYSAWLLNIAHPLEIASAQAFAVNSNDTYKDILTRAQFGTLFRVIGPNGEEYFPARHALYPPSVIPPDVPVDEHFANVTLLCQFMGADGSTVFPDVSPAARGNATPSGNAKISTTDTVLGFESSLLCDGTGDFIQWPTAVILDNPTFANAVWTMECFWHPTHSGDLWGNLWTGAPFFGWFYQYVTVGAFRAFSFGAYDWNPTPITVPANSSYYLCFESNGTKIRMYSAVLGVDTEAAFDGSITPGTATGMQGGSGGFMVFNAGFAGVGGGRMNCLRITDGVARYDTEATYSIPEVPFPETGP